MIVYLAGIENAQKIITENNYSNIGVLGSFFYVKEWMLPYIKNEWDFLLDSGAYTFMTQQKKGIVEEIDWNDYVEKYADFINQNNVKYFFELDIDSLIGIKKVEILRTKLESLTNKKSIPVWHKSRGKDYWFKMIDEYDYVAVGGLIDKGISGYEEMEKYFPWFLNTAKEKNCKVHALGYTSIPGLHKYPFHSVDSTSWSVGGRFGRVAVFKNGKFVTNYKPNNRKGKKDINKHNFKQWIKFQNYAKYNL